MKTIIKYFILLGVFFLFGCISLVNAQGVLSSQNDYSSTNNPMRNNGSMRRNNSSSEINYVRDDYMQNNDYNQKQLSNPINEPKLSSVEELFNSDMKLSLGSKQTKLRQIGYDLFSSGNAQGFGKYDGSYKLNIGERVDVYVWGDSVDMLSISGTPILSPLTKSQVDGKGNLFVSGIGLVKAEGLSVSDIERSIQSLASKKFTNVKVKITVADSTEFSVFVYGYVRTPGKVAIGNNSSILEALAAAGGVSKNGSLRNVTYKSSGASQSVDLYNVIFHGKDSNVRLKPNDTIFVNSIGSVVAIKNGVKIPGIYEIKPLDSLAGTIEYAGGLLPSTDKSIMNIKAYSSKDGQRKSIDVPYEAVKKTRLANGDILEFRNLYGKAEDFVSLEGNIKHPATFEYRVGMRLSDVLKGKNELQDETFIHQAVIKRVSGDDKQVISIPVSLEDFFNGGNNPSLQPKDIITVYKNTNSEFIEVYGCINNPKQLPYNANLTLKDVMADVQFIASSSSNVNNEKNNEDNLQNVAMVTSDNVVIPAYDIAVEITNENNYDYSDKQNRNNDKLVNNPTNEEDKKLNVKTIYLYDVLVQNDTIADITINPGDKILFRPLREDEIVKTVKVSGYINKPGVYKFVEGKKLLDAINTAGGLSKNANLKGIVFKRAALAQKEQEAVAAKNKKDAKQLQGQMASDTNATKDDIESRQQALEDIQRESENSKDKYAGRIALNIKSNDLSKFNEAENIEIQDGDEIYIPKISNHVMVIGEVYNETSFVYKKGAKASYYIDLVGGYTPNARRTKLYKIGVNGQARKLRLIASNNIDPGDTIVVPRKIRGNDWITPVASTLQAIASMLTSVFVVTKL